MTDRDRLIEFCEDVILSCKASLCDDCEHNNIDYPHCMGVHFADYLLANGVIVPPCKVGDKMYKLCSVNSAIELGQMWDGKIVKTNCDRCGYKNCSCYDIGLRELSNPYFIDVIEEKTIQSLEFSVKIMPYVGIVWFTTKEEAEKALKEIKTRGA